ncbi:F-box domain-containing protein [Caenorhabditis elegans]|uniref:F-box domain-containing protein n=1 Tax=Caenorhabditis elegans TaxID=6239 RepID=A3RMU2_CAEEL|nr:F-box domain-containing protein [Caenorhabditis elegans]CAM35834.2 F-box domain-containing protein [Caenorhabditis elegans]
MSVTLEENPIAIRTCILYEFRKNLPIFESFKNFCHVLGDDLIGFPEFEFWFYRFYKGDFDLNYDRSQETIHPTLFDLPLQIHDKILKNLNVLERLNLRNVCFNFRKISDEPPTQVVINTINTGMQETTFKFDCGLNHYVMICKDVDNDCIITSSCKYDGQKEWKVEGASVFPAVLGPFLRKCPVVDCLVLTSWTSRNGRLMSCMESTKPSVKKLVLNTFINHENYFLLKNVREVQHISIVMVPDALEVDQLIELEQWKNAVSVSVNYLLDWNIEHFHHFQNAIIFLKHMTVENAVKVKKLLE